MSLSLSTLQKTAALIRKASQIHPHLLQQLERARVNAEYRQELFVDVLALTAEILLNSRFKLTATDAQILRDTLFAAIEANEHSLQTMVGFTSLMAAGQRQSFLNCSGRKTASAKAAVFQPVDKPHGELHHWSNT